jgi:hypothetical protein
MQEEIDRLLVKMCDPEEKEAYLFADKLGKLIDDAGKDRLIELVKGEKWEVGYLAARALSNSSFNEESLDAVFETINNKVHRAHQGAFVQVLELFDLSDRFIDVFKVFLFGNFKASTLAKAYLDEVEFDISPRTIRKAEKHWNHYLHNPEEEGSLEVKKMEVELMFSEMKELFEGE